ncbi:MAG TPA: hypothetical protein VMZ69_08590 [Saprospiraceae bacterium]|nr:hypothetical protein [Saprospiraceae bacterium]
MSRFFYLIGIVMVFMSCGKDIDLFIPRSNQGEVGDLSRLMSRLNQDISGNISYVIQVPCNGNKIIQVDKDLVLIIPADFVDLTQFPCTDGSFDVHVTVCDTKSEILIAGIPTLSEGKLLESRIEIKLQITDGYTNVHLAPGKQISIKVKDPDPRDRMELFYGNDDNSAWLQVDNDPNAWDNVANGEWVLQDSTGLISGFGYECLSDSLDWVNIDVFFEIPEDQRTDVCVELPVEFTNKNTAVFMILDDYNSIIRMRGNADVMKFCEPYGSAPIGFNVTFVVISEMGDDSYQFATKSTTIGAHHVEVLSPLKTPYEEIKNFILQL